MAVKSCCSKLEVKQLYIIDKIGSSVKYEEREVDAPPTPRSIIGLASVSQELSKGDRGALEIDASKVLSTHRSMDAICLENRDAVVRSSPNRECAVQPGKTTVNGMSNNFPCVSNTCGGGLCTGIRAIDPFSRAYQDDSTERTQGYRANYRYKPRMRGGGHWNEDKFDFNREKCLNSNYRNAAIDRVPIQSVDTLISGACKSPLKIDTESSKPGCGCFGRSGTGMMGTKSAATKSGAACSNDPCLGVDCLIRAFNETQEFVDSIGKIRGLAGLGLMDPAESPFFGRERDEIPTSCVPQIGVSPTTLGVKASGVHPHPVQQNAETVKRCETRAISPILPTPVAGLVSSKHRDSLAIYRTEKHSRISGKVRKKAEERSEKQKETHREPNHRTAVGEGSGPRSYIQVWALRAFSIYIRVTTSEAESSQFVRKWLWCEYLEVRDATERDRAAISLSLTRACSMA